MSILQDISKQLLAVASMPPEKRNDKLSELAVIIQGWKDYEIAQEQKYLITTIIEELIAENDAEQIAKSKLVFVPDVEEQIAPTKKTRAKKVVTPVAEDLPDFIDSFSTIKDLPLPIRKLGGLRRKEQGRTEFIDMSDTLTTAFDWESSSEGDVFWETIHAEGDLREFKKLYGNKGEKVDEIIEFAELNEFVEGLSQQSAEAPASAVKTRKPRTPKAPAVSQSTLEDLPDVIAKFTSVKDLPESVKNLAFFRGEEQNELVDLNDILARAFKWDDTPEGENFWKLINTDGDLTEFKKKYGNKGEKVDAIINPAPVVKTKKPRTPKVVKNVEQEINKVVVLFNSPQGAKIKLDNFSFDELFDGISLILNKLKYRELSVNIEIETDNNNYFDTVILKQTDMRFDFFITLVNEFSKIRPLLNWNSFYAKQIDETIRKLNEIEIENAFNPAPVVLPKPAKAVTPKPAKAVTPKPVKVVAPKVTKPKVTKPKVEDDLSFLDDLDNIF